MLVSKYNNPTHQEWVCCSGRFSWRGSPLLGRSLWYRVTPLVSHWSSTPLIDWSICHGSTHSYTKLSISSWLCCREGIESCGHLCASKSSTCCHLLNRRKTRGFTDRVSEKLQNFVSSMSWFVYLNVVAMLIPYTINELPLLKMVVHWYDWGGDKYKYLQTSNQWNFFLLINELSSSHCSNFKSCQYVITPSHFSIWINKK